MFFNFVLGYTFGSGSFNNSPDLFGKTSSSNNGTSPLYQQLPLNLPAPPEINNNNRIQMGGVQFIPSRLPSGEFALVMPNSGSSSEQWKPFYSVDTLSHRSNALDLNESIPRSAFSNVSKLGKHLDTSPLSPASSLSSIDDSSSMNQTDLQTSVDTSSPQRTPQKTCLSAFPTPPSGGSITLIPTTHSSQLQNSTITSATTLQQPHVTSTTEQSSLKIRQISFDLSLKETESENAIMTDVSNVAKKRPHSNESSEMKKQSNENSATNLDYDEAILKIPKSEPNDSSINCDDSNNDDRSESCNGDMWRPW